MRILVVLALFVCVALAQPIVKRDWTRVNGAEGTLESVQTAFFPRVASFSDGRYILVYTIRTQNSRTRVYGQIFNADGSSAGAEFDVDPDASDTNEMASPTVAVFPDDTFIIAYRWDSGDPTSVWARRFESNGGPLGVNFRVDTDGGIVVIPKGIELIGYADKSFAVVYNSGVAECPYVVFVDSSDNVVEQFCVYDATAELSTAAVLDSTGTTAYATVEADIPYVYQGVLANGRSSLNNYGPVDASVAPSSVAIALTADSIVTVVYMLENSIHYATSMLFDRFSTAVLAQADGFTYLPTPAVLSLNDTSLLIAYKAITPTGDEVLYYNIARLTLGDTIDLAFTSEQYGLASLHGLHMVPINGGSDIVVVAKDPASAGIFQQILTFCGNGFIELQEECDSTANCDANCRCTNGLIGYNGVCGYPNVIPVLDCIDPTNTNGRDLYFSFINEDGIVQTMDYGPQNSFLPAGLAADRPTLFGVGSTLTYPASPYMTSVPSSAAQVTWLLGSYNLTVDLSPANVAALQCPESPGFTVDVGAAGYIYDGELMASNFAARYGLSTSRLSTSVVQTMGNPPVRKRGTIVFSNAFDVTIVVAPTNATTAEELSSADAVRTVVEEFKDSATQSEVETDLLEGYGDTDIKEITPTPTGVEVRGTRQEAPSVIPSAAPTSSDTNPTSVPTSVAPPSGNVSHSNILLPCLALVSAVVIAIM